MKPGSRQAMPLRAEADDRLRHVEIDHDARAELLQRRRLDDGRAASPPAGEPNTLSSRPTRLSRVDGADDRDLDAAAGDDRPMHGDEIVARDRRHALGRAGGRAAIGMAGEALLEEAARRHDAGIVLLVAQARDGLRAHALDGILIEARLGEREAQQLESLVRMLDQGLQRAAERIVAGIEGQLDGARREALLERVGIVVARALVEQAGEHLRHAGLVRGIVRGAALEDEGDGDQRHHVGFDVPGLDTARRGQRLHHRSGDEDRVSTEAVMVTSVLVQALRKPTSADSPSRNGGGRDSARPRRRDRPSGRPRSRPASGARPRWSRRWRAPSRRCGRARIGCRWNRSSRRRGASWRARWNPHPAPRRDAS